MTDPVESAVQVVKVLKDKIDEAYEQVYKYPKNRGGAASRGFSFTRI